VKNLKWHTGRKVPINVYEGERPVCQCHTAIDAQRIVSAMNAWDRRGIITEGKEITLTDRIEQLEVQLAGCGAAANGATKEPAIRGQWGWSPAYQDVLELRVKYDKLRNKIATKG
jgi:hypothetical protein